MHRVPNPKAFVVQLHQHQSDAVREAVESDISTVTVVLGRYSSAARREIVETGLLGHLNTWDAAKLASKSIIRKYAYCSFRK
jgi:hypothetical protein